MGSSVTNTPSQTTTRQSLRLAMVRHFCERLGLDLVTVAYQRFHKTYAELSDEQSLMLHDSLKQAYVRSVGKPRK